MNSFLHKKKIVKDALVLSGHKESGAITLSSQNFKTINDDTYSEYLTNRNVSTLTSHHHKNSPFHLTKETSASNYQRRKGNSFKKYHKSIQADNQLLTLRFQPFWYQALRVYYRNRLLCMPLPVKNCD